LEGFEMRTQALGSLFATAAFALVGCMGVDTREFLTTSVERNAAVRSGLDLIAQLERATGVKITEVRRELGNRLGFNGNNAATGASDIVLGVQLSVGAEDPQAPKLPSSLNFTLRIAYTFCYQALGQTPLPRIFSQHPVTTMPTEDTLRHFLRESQAYFGSESLSDAHLKILSEALMSAFSGRTARESWAAACATIASAPNADII
jgi:hypothetical protein